MPKKWMRISVACLGLGLLALVLVLHTQKKEDGLEWIRRFNPQENVVGLGQQYLLTRSFKSSAGIHTAVPSTDWRTYEFTFKKVPQEVIFKLGNGRISGTGNSMGKLPDGGWFMLRPSIGRVTITRENDSTWLEKQWTEIKHFFGAKKQVSASRVPNSP